MAVPNQTPYKKYTANGSTTQFSLGFNCESKDHLIVTIDEVEAVTGSWSLSSGNVVFLVAPSSGKTIELKRNTPASRSTDYQSYNNSFNPQAINRDIDWIWFKLQELGVADWVLGQRINALKNYVDRKDDELKSYLLEAIRKQGVALDQLDDYYNYLMERLAQIAVDKGWDASFVVDGDENQHQINNKTIRFVNLISNLLAIKNPRNGQVVYVDSIAKNYTYKPSTTETENGVTVVGKWVMEIPDAYYASWFADPDSTESQALKLQLGSDYATSKNRTLIVDKAFWVDGRAIDCSLPQGDRAAFLVRTKSKTVFLPHAELKILPNAYSNYHGIIACNDVSDYVLIKPKVTGDRLTHDYSGGGSQEWGYGITIYESSNGVLIRPKAVNTTGDGIYVGKAWNSMLTTSPKNIIIDKPAVDYTRRNGMSITACEGLDINNPVVDHIGDFNGITGAFPKACIDIEPENGVGKAKSEIIGLRIHNPTLQNSDAGFLAYASLNSDSTGRKFEVSVTGNVVIRNIRATGSGIFIHPATIGFLNISSLQFTTAPAVSLVSSVGVSTTFSATIAEFHYVGGVFHSIIDRFQGTNSNIGNLLIENVINRFDKWCPVLIDTNSDRVLTINNLQVYVKDKTQVGVTTYTDDPSIQASFGGKRNYLESLDSFVYESWSTSSKAMPNEIWQNPSVDNTGETPIFINTSADYRVLKVGLFHQTATIGQGCNINGLNLVVDGVTKTQAKTLTLGGWIKFQNIEGTRTRIHDSYGVWAFS